MPASPWSPHRTCASDSMTSLITGCPWGSLFSSFTYVTWYPRICPCCLLEMGSFQLTRMAVEFTDSTSTFRGGALGTAKHTRWTVSRYRTTAVTPLLPSLHPIARMALLAQAPCPDPGGHAAVFQHDHISNPFPVTKHFCYSQYKRALL